MPFGDKTKLWLSGHQRNHPARDVVAAMKYTEMMIDVQTLIREHVTPMFPIVHVGACRVILECCLDFVMRVRGSALQHGVPSESCRHGSLIRNLPKVRGLV